VGVRSLMSWPGLLRTLFSNARLAWRLLREPRVPIWAKAVPVAALVYLVSPLDFIPDVMPFVGEVDDLAVVLIALQAFLSICPSRAVLFHREALAQGQRFTPMPATGEVIEAEWRREN
jgi:uncharacterized membrane protein YkvA (DUF1232 family)